MRNNISPKIREFRVKRPNDRQWKKRKGLGIEQVLIQYHNARYPWRGIKGRYEGVKIEENFEKEVWKVGFLRYHIKKETQENY